MITLDMLGTLQEQIFSAIVQARYSMHSSIRTYVTTNGTIEAIFSLFFYIFLTIINADIWNIESF